MDKKSITILPNFLTLAESSHLIKVATPLLKQSPTGHLKSTSAYRTSSTAFLVHQLDPVLTAIASRVSKLTGYSIDNIEPFQVVRYAPGEVFGEHVDYFPPESDGYEIHMARGGNRLITLFGYLNTVDQGGETYFPVLDQSFRPKKNDVIAWFNVDEEGVREEMVHEGRPATTTKWGINVWVRERRFLFKNPGEK